MEYSMDTSDLNILVSSSWRSQLSYANYPIFTIRNNFKPPAWKLTTFRKRYGKSRAGSTAVIGIISKIYKKDNDRPCYEETIVNVGDSRALRIKTNGDVEQLTRDHKALEPEGSHSNKESRWTCNQRSVEGNLSVSRSFGDTSFKDNTKLDALAQQITFEVYTECWNVWGKFCLPVTVSLKIWAHAK